MNIRKLPEHLITKIAAGEVVERPSNIVKELVENSIDANSTKITIQITEGGLKRVYVQDDGSGIPENQLFSAFELHTTSKLVDDEISHVATLGFRGEALASIAAVSRVVVVSKISSQHQACKIIMEGGKIVSRENSQSRVISDNGTAIEVTGLFFNTPARRKFLKKASTERKRITEMLSHFILMYPSIHFIFEEIDKDGRAKPRLISPTRKSLLPVIYDILGHEVAGNLIALNGKIGDWDISGYISIPNFTRKDRSNQYICVNGRIIRHIELQNAIELGYGSQLMRAAHPFVILQLQGPIDAIDFNIHPQKSEIRFRTEDIIIADLQQLVRETLDHAATLPALSSSKLSKIKSDKTGRNPSTLPNDIVEHKEVTGSEALQESTKLEQKDDWFHQTSFDSAKTPLFTPEYFVLGHIMKKFGIISTRSNELWLVDIHAADERIKFEQYALGSQRIALSQQLLEPLSIVLLTVDKQILLDHVEQIKKFGLLISDGGADDILVHSFPVYFDQQITKQSINELLLDLSNWLGGEHDGEALSSPFDNIEYGIVSRLACHGSIRSGVSIGNQRIAKVIDQLLLCNNPWTCAHGRPTVLRISKSQLEGWFNR